jgi:hypothetical protein
VSAAITVFIGWVATTFYFVSRQSVAHDTTVQTIKRETNSLITAGTLGIVVQIRFPPGFQHCLRQCLALRGHDLGNDGVCFKILESSVRAPFSFKQLNTSLGQVVYSLYGMKSAQSAGVLGADLIL